MTTADLIIVNAKIHTMDGLNPHADAIAVQGGRILAVGAEADVSNVANGTTKRMDAGGRVLLPGFQDTHIHLQDSGVEFHRGVDLAGSKNIGELQARVRKQAADTPNNVWVQGLCWDPGTFPVTELNRHLIDEAVSDRPVYLMASDGHNAVVNSMALRELNITAETPNPPNGEIVKGDDGEPNGMLYEDAIWWALGMLPKATKEDLLDGTKEACAHANKHGITGVLDAMSGERHMQVYTGLDNAGELNLRVAATSKVFPHDDLDDAMGRLNFLRETYRSEKVYMHSAKFFLDGVMENGTASMLEDYETGGNYPIMFDEDHLEKLLIAFDADRFQLHLHTIGDKAVRVALDGIEAARRANGPWPALHQLAHIQCIDDADIPRFAELGAVANFQPLWACPEGGTDIAVKMVGEKRARNIYAVKSVIETGAPYAISSDWFVSTLNPFAIMAVAITRQNIGEGPNSPAFYPEECIDVETVVRGYTTNAAAGAWRANTTGSLARGKYADLIILDRDIFHVSPSEIAETVVDFTMLNGEEVQRSGKFDR
ncbi:MAG: amidohydrolase [Rhodospirillales bacterium]|jgi:predicted amidohydrolase YtcJ|nr:amidohydrolase [Rhodospirillales bacterium]MBT4041327.1 amidohydrolase [Rhodospirillales bacterium]MBT4626974.1 amidohydrolase [Rhodospirillales bacterium]MBT5352204.1 amidohydrolase [Rhodospirillales bacterium]MBT6110138.1 amidohydrolase [Rhodospirillales bacterium]